MGVGFGGGFGGFGLVYHRKIRPTQLWVELSWVVAKIFVKLCTTLRLPPGYISLLDCPVVKINGE